MTEHGCSLVAARTNLTLQHTLTLEVYLEKRRGLEGKDTIPRFLFRGAAEKKRGKGEVCFKRGLSICDVILSQSLQNVEGESGVAFASGIWNHTSSSFL